MPSPPPSVVERAYEVNFGDSRGDVLLEQTLPIEEIRISRRRHIYSGLADVMSSHTSVGWAQIVRLTEHVTAPSRLGLATERMVFWLAKDFGAADIIGERAAGSVNPLGDRFAALTRQWYEQRGISSSTHDIVLCEAYQQIIGMGERVLPLIFEKLKSEGTKPDQWFWALRSITGENPVPRELWGRRKEMAKIWLQWGEQRGYATP